MTSRPWMPLYFEDFRADTLDLDTDEIAVYFILILLAWRHGSGSVTGDMGDLKRALKCCIANFHGLTFNRVVPKILARYFELRNDGRFYQQRVVMELQKAREYSENASRNANKRWSGSKHFKDLGHAMAMLTQSHKKERGETEKEQTRKEGVKALQELTRSKGWVS